MTILQFMNNRHMPNPLIQQLHVTSRLTITSPQCMAVSPQQCITSQPLSITPQQSLAKFTPSSSDEDSNTSPLPVEELENAKKCCNQLVPKDVKSTIKQLSYNNFQFCISTFIIKELNLFENAATAISLEDQFEMSGILSIHLFQPDELIFKI